MMSRTSFRTAAGVAIVALAAVAATAFPARAQQAVLNIDPALRGPLSVCAWFDDNINDRSMDSIIRQTDMLYNRVALLPDQPVSNVVTGTAQSGTKLAQFDLYGRTLLCSQQSSIIPEPQATLPPGM